MKKTLFLMTSVALMVASCGDNKKTEESSQTTEQQATTTDTPAASQNTDAVTVNLEGTDQMTFNLKEIKAKAGQTINLTLKHVGQMDKKVMGHNFVLLKKGTDVAAFAEAAMGAASTDYIPNNGADVIAHTKLLGGGESDSISFKAPEPGTYDFICSFPGHYAMMKGVLIVE